MSRRPAPAAPASEANRPASACQPAPATLLAGFDHTGQRAPFARLTSLIDGTNQRASKPKTDAADVTSTPTYFSGNLRSLSDAFASLASERFAERRDGPILRQTVTYQWQHP